MVLKNQDDLFNVCAAALFSKKIEIKKLDFFKIVKEAKLQAVLPLVENKIFVHYKDAHEEAMKIVSKNIQVFCAHEEVHRLLTNNKVPYVVLKGVASASYYKEPVLRTMGDVDLFVAADDFDKCDKLLCSIGYIKEKDAELRTNHVAFRKRVGNNNIVCELHHKINGVPDNDANVINKYLENIFDKAYLYSSQNSACIVPSTFHHGIILLLHTASHLTSEGIGLRHLCDWAVFVNSLSNDEFVKVFEKPLKEMGLWRFARLITLCCARYLGCDCKDWAGEADDELLEAIIADVLDGGNFGFKDNDRCHQIKYIKHRNDKTVDGKKSLFQALFTINSKAKHKCKFVRKHKWLLPIGWVVVVFNYIWLVLSGKRKLDSFSTIDRANARKKIYSEFHLYKPE
ncbi:MAG: nucleotidyltransferase family protein [Oscillospiraceae bacterium]|nr:nucleotidyltransferase family protein [Oscillospiraceae bacterium]